MRMWCIGTDAHEDKRQWEHLNKRPLRVGNHDEVALCQNHLTPLRGYLLPLDIGRKTPWQLANRLASPTGFIKAHYQSPNPTK